MVVRYPQPPGDEGTRKKLANRKATVANVGQGFMGIVNIYQLVPKGSPAVPITSLGIPPPQSGTKIYPQQKQKKKTTAEILGIEKKLSLGHSDVGWKYDSSERNDRLAVKDGNIFGQFITATRDYSPKARSIYEEELSKHPNLIASDMDSKKLKNAIVQLQKVSHDPVKFDEMLLKQAMNLKTHYVTIKNIYNDTMRLLAERNIEKEKVIQLEESPTRSQFISPMVSAPKKILPSQLQGAKLISLGTVESNRDRYIKLNELEVAKANPLAVVYAENKGNIQYYLDSKSVVDRRKKHSKTKVKRKIIPRKVSKSSIRKKVILKKLKCKCRKGRY